MIKDIILPVANFARVSDNLLRGETLWAARNRKCLDLAKEAGIDVIIDFRTADFTDKFKTVCMAKELSYFHCPIDKANMSDIELLNALPRLFELMDNHNCYISCQQGMHRTDIALAIYYMFHDIDFIPELRGHKKNGHLRCDDIMRRVNSLYAAMTLEIKKALGIPEYDDNLFSARRKALLEYNRN